MQSTIEQPKLITSLDEFLDYVIKESQPSVDHNVKEFMEKMHRNIVKAKRSERPVHGDVLIAYFEMYALIRQEKVSRTRLVSTAQGVIMWLHK